MRFVDINLSRGERRVGPLAGAPGQLRDGAGRLLQCGVLKIWLDRQCCNIYSSYDWLRP